MTYKDHEKLSEENLQRFDDLLVAVYKKLIEECHVLLRKEIARLFLRRDTNSKYIPALKSDMDDLVQTVFSRFVTFNGRSSKTLAEKIEGFEMTLKAIIRRVHLEKLRELRVLPEPIEPVGSDGAATLSEPAQPTENQIQGIKKEIRLDCLRRCEEKLPPRIKNLFTRYYPRGRVAPNDLAEMRLRLAYEEAGRPRPEFATPEQDERVLNNVQSKIFKWRTKKLNDCVKKCVEDTESGHIGLNYLEDQ